MPASSRQLSFKLLRISAFALSAALGTPVAHAQTVVNNQSVTVPPFTIPFNDDLIVGSTGTGSVTVTNATLFVNDVTLGDAASGNGTLTLDGSLAALSVGGDYKIGNSGTGTFNILNGAGAQTSFGATLGSMAGSTGTATLSGSGSFWTDAGNVYVGGQGVGTMTVSNGAQFNGGSFVVGSSTGSAGSSVTVTGVDSEFNLSSSLTIGDDGDATFNVTNGATLAITGGIYVGYGEAQGVFNVSGGSTVTSAEADFGYYSDAGKGTGNISGAGTTWSIDGNLTLGDEGGAGELNITSGAHVSVTGDLRMGTYDENITRGDLLISGAGSQLTVDGDANIGEERPAIVVVSNGGYLRTGDATIASEPSAPSSVTITGVGSVWDVDDLTVGEYGMGTVTVTNGGQVNSAGEVTIGYGSDAQGVFNVTNAGKVYSGSVTLGNYGYPMSGEMNISGAGSEWHVTGDIDATYDYGATAINVTNGGLLDVTGALTLGSYGSNPDDVANMMVSGSGTRAEFGGNAYIGSGAVANLVVTNGAQFTAADMSIGNGSGKDAKVTISNGSTVSVDSVEIRESGTLNFGAAATDAAAASGTLTAPTVTFSSGSGGTVVFNHTNSLTFGAALASSSAGYGDVQVLAGTTTFTAGTGAYSGTVEVSGGKAVFNANVGGDVTVSGSGIVGGSGTIGALDVQNGGTVAPGNSPGTINVVGNTTFASGSRYAVEVAGSAVDLINTGSATINGGTVRVSGSPTLMQYTILTSTAVITGPGFDGVDSTSAFILYSLDYDPNNVYLVVDGVNSLTTAARTPNQYAVANALDRFPSDNPLYTAIVSGSVADAQQAFNALSGEIHASVGSALADDSRYVREAITGRLIQAYYGGAAAGGGQPIVMASAAPTDVVEMDSTSRMSLGAGYASSRDAAPSAGHDLAWWSRAFGAWGEYNTNGNAATTDRNLGGFITGVDSGLGGGWRAGLVTGYMYTGLSVDDRWSSANINSYVLGGYAGGALGGGFALRSGGTWTWNSIDSNRSVIFPGFYEGEAANYNGDVGQLFAELAYPVFTHGGVVEPFAGLAYVHVGTDGFTESGPVAGLTSGGLDMNLGYGTLGARTGTTMVWGATTVIPHASLAWQYAFGDTTPEQALAFASTGIGMGIGGVPLAQNSALVDVGIDALVAQDATLGISYIGQYSGDFTDTGLRGRFNWKF